MSTSLYYKYIYFLYLKSTKFTVWIEKKLKSQKYELRKKCNYICLHEILSAPPPLSACIPLQFLASWRQLLMTCFCLWLLNIRLVPKTCISSSLTEIRLPTYSYKIFLKIYMVGSTQESNCNLSGNATWCKSRWQLMTLQQKCSFQILQLPVIQPPR